MPPVRFAQSDIDRFFKLSRDSKHIVNRPDLWLRHHICFYSPRPGASYPPDGESLPGSGPIAIADFVDGLAVWCDGAPGDPQRDSLWAANLDRIRVGMTEGETAALLGPPRHEFTKRVPWKWPWPPGRKQRLRRPLRFAQSDIDEFL